MYWPLCWNWCQSCDKPDLHESDNVNVNAADAPAVCGAVSLRYILSRAVSHSYCTFIDINGQDKLLDQSSDVCAAIIRVKLSNSLLLLQQPFLPTHTLIQYIVQIHTGSHKVSAVSVVFKVIFPILTFFL